MLFFVRVSDSQTPPTQGTHPHHTTVVRSPLGKILEITIGKRSPHGRLRRVATPHLLSNKHPPFVSRLAVCRSSVASSTHCHSGSEFQLLIDYEIFGRATRFISQKSHFKHSLERSNPPALVQCTSRFVQQPVHLSIGPIVHTCQIRRCQA